MTGVAVLCAVALAGPTAFATNDDQIARLKRLSVDELLDVEVTSVSRREQGLRNAAAAVAVLSGDDLRRSGATSVPEALRLVPGLHVGRLDSSSWNVSARGFSSANSEKLLVLSDTRSIYTPLFSGVFWDVQDYLLEDIERIEVIRGPGAALWGSNAVNGVISISTRSARDTHGSYLEAGVGDFDRVALGARHGGETRGGKHYRVFGHFVDRDGTYGDFGGNDDAWSLGHVGFRTDWDSDAESSWTVQGDAYVGDIGQAGPTVQVLGRPGPAPPLEVEVSGGNLLARWRHRTGESSDLQLRAYYDLTRRDDPSFVDTLHTVDVDLQQRFMRTRHELVWGAAFRLTANQNRSGGVFAVDPERSEDVLWSGFVQDQIALTEALEVTVGTKLEYNDFSGFEVQPSARAAWRLSPRQTLWGAVSRAVRVPTRLERDVAIDATDPAGNPVLRLVGNRDFDAERLVAYELGHRWQPGDDLSFDLTAFYNDYDRLSSLELGTPFLEGGRTIIPILNQNLTEGRSRGAELLAEWQPVPQWRLSAMWSHVDLELRSAGLDLNRGVWFDGATPRNQFGLRSWWTLGDFELDAQIRRHSRIRRLPVDTTGGGIDAYAALDLRLGWRASEEWFLALVGQNLLDEHHLEFGTPGARGEIERSVYLKAEWRRE